MTDRQLEMLRLFEKEGFLTIHYLSQKLFMSEPTVRRELASLASQGMIRRIRGGATLLSREQGELPLSYSLKTQTREKRLIAEQAARMVRDKDTIFLDASSTALFMLPFLQEAHELTILTDGLETAQFSAERGINTYCIGGLVNARAKSCAGPFTEGVINCIHVNFLFFSAPAVSPLGDVMHHSAEKAAMLRALMPQAQRRVLLCNSEKFTKTATFRICRTDEVDDIVCDLPLPESLPVRNGASIAL